MRKQQVVNMSPKQKQKLRFKTPLGLDQFAELSQRLTDAPERSQKTDLHLWHQVNPVEALGADERTLARYGSALGELVGRRTQVPTRQRKKLPGGIGFTEDLMVDRADALVRTQDIGVAQAIEEVMHTSLKDTNFINAKVMSIHVKARMLREMNPTRIPAAKATLRAMLGGAIQESTGILQQMNDRYQRLNGNRAGAVAGLLVEGMYVAYQLAKEYRAGGVLEGWYPRFALDREDKPSVATPRGKLGFDAVHIHGDRENMPVQVKASRASNAYVPEIKVWTPNMAVANEGDRVLGWFDTLINNEAPEIAINDAWQELQRRFDPAEPLDS